jgi:Chromatin modification-related protein EAF7
MYCILTNLRRYGWGEDHISRDGVWKKLDTLYNMEALHERVSRGFLNCPKQHY